MAFKFLQLFGDRLKEVVYSPPAVGQVYMPYSGQWGVNATTSSASTTISSMLANTIHWSPLVVPYDTEIDKLTFQLTSDSSGSRMKMTLYDSNPTNGRPLNKLYESASTPITAANAEAGFDCSLTLEAGKLYWAGIWGNSAAPNMARITTGSGSNTGRSSAAYSSSAFHSATNDLTYDAGADTAPSVWTTSLVRRTAGWPLVLFRVV